MRDPGRCPHLLLLYRAMIPSVVLCADAQCRELARTGRVEYRAVHADACEGCDLEWADTVIVGRLDMQADLGVAQRVRAAKRRVLYVLDDDLLHLPEGLTSTRHYRSPDVRRVIRGFLSVSDGLLSPSPRLLRKYASGPRRAIRVVEPALRFAPFVSHSAGAPVKIGFAGSIDRVGDVESVLGEALCEVKRLLGDRVEFEFFGVAPSFAGALGARLIPFCEKYDDYLELICSLGWDIGLAPMPDTAFHSCKHYIKCIEYAAAGVAPVCSDYEPYNRLRRWISPSAFVMNRPSDWTDAIVRLVNDRAELERRRREAHDWAAAHMTVAASADEMWSRYGDTLSYIAPVPRIRFARLRHSLQALFERGVRFLARNGLRSPIVLVQKLTALLRARH